MKVITPTEDDDTPHKVPRTVRTPLAYSVEAMLYASSYAGAASADPQELSVAGPIAPPIGGDPPCDQRRYPAGQRGVGAVFPGPVMPWQARFSTAPSGSAHGQAKTASGPSTANRRTVLIAVHAFPTARFNSRCVRAGPRSPTCCAIVHPLRVGRSLANPDTYGVPLLGTLQVMPACG